MAELSDQAIVATVVDELPVGVWVARAPGGEFVYANRMFGEIMGTGPRSDVGVGGYAQPYGIHTRDGALYPEDRLPFVLALQARATVTVDDIVIHRPDGGRVDIRAQARPVFGASGEITHVVIAFIDITREVEADLARAESEQRLRQAQKMESIGNLAGGIAHDFNNLLAAIRVIASTLQRTEVEPERIEAFDQIDQAAESAVQLTRSLLGFARRGKHLAARISINDVARAVTGIVERSLDRRIEIETDFAAESGDVVGDFSQLEQLLMNLIVNARDAMPEGGRLAVRTRDVALIQAEARRRPPLKPGRHVMLEVQDDGAGIDPAIRDRIFEPYFTAKVAGAVRGSGLGLATAFGIVQSHGGMIEVEDARPRGTIARVYVPAAPPSERVPITTPPPRSVRLGEGTVLVVDDEPLVNAATSLALRKIGYSVLRARDGVEAVEIYRQRGPEIVAVVLDMVMPRLDGRGTYLALRELNPDVRVLLTTGFALNDEAQRIIDLGVRGFLAKPFDIHTLSEALAEVIAGGRRRS